MAVVVPSDNARPVTVHAPSPQTRTVAGFVCRPAAGDWMQVLARAGADGGGFEMTITVLLMTIMTQLQHHTVVAEYNTREACEVAAQAHRKVLMEINFSVVYSCSPKAGSR